MSPPPNPRFCGCYKLKKLCSSLRRNSSIHLKHMHSSFRGHQCDVRVPTRWWLNLFLLLLPRWHPTATCVVRCVLSVIPMSDACHAEQEYPQDGGHGKKADGLYSVIQTCSSHRFAIEYWYYWSVTSSNFLFCISAFSWPYFSRTWWKTLTHQIWHELVHGGPRYSCMNT